MHNHISFNDVSSVEKSSLYRSYMQSKGEHPFRKVQNLVRICRSFGIEDDLYKVLDKIWIKNKDVVILLYEIPQNPSWRAIANYYKSHATKVSTDNIIYNKDDFINDIHDDIDYFINLYEMTTNEDNLSFKD
jgi:hypothetical protein